MVKIISLIVCKILKCKGIALEVGFLCPEVYTALALLMLSTCGPQFFKCKF